MRILFVFRSAFSNNSPAQLIYAQASTLNLLLNNAQFYPIVGKSYFSYILNGIRLRGFIKNHSIDIIHAHYSLSGLPAVLAFSGKPVVLSLMGSDILGEHITQRKTSFRSKIVKIVTRVVQYFVDAIIVKSQNIYDQVSRKSITSIIPNGVDLKIFTPIDKMEARKTLELLPEKKYVLYLANPANVWKNYNLAEEAIKQLNDPDIILLAPYPIPHNEIPLYLNAADVFISTSFMEGSSNVIKEAMACNCPVVATDVGDASQVMGDTRGCYMIGFHPEEVAVKIGLALSFSKTHNRTYGRERIMQLGLDSETVALKIIDVYKSVLVK